jgi:hypothetical protein
LEEKSGEKYLAKLEGSMVDLHAEGRRSGRKKRSPLQSPPKMKMSRRGSRQETTKRKKTGIPWERERSLPQ